MERNAKKTPVVVLSAMLVILTTLVSVVFGYRKGWDTTTLISFTVFILLGTLTVLFLHAFCRDKHLYSYDNEEHFGRFVFLWVLSLGVTSVCSYLPVAGWPLPVVFLWFTLFGNLMLGITSGSVIVLLTTLFAGAGIEVFTIYFLCGVLCSCLFYKLDQNYKIMVPLIVSMLGLMVGLTAGVVLFTNEKLHLEMFIIPLTNVVVSVILMVVVLKIFSGIYIYRYRGKYLEIIDPEFPLQVQLKQEHRVRYYQSMHTAYFCDRIAKSLNLNAEALKAAGYYQHIGALKGKENWENTKDLCEEYEFPPAVHTILREVLDKETVITAKETAVLVFSDAVITAILYLMERQPDAKPDYDKVVDTVFKTKLKTGIFSKCQLTLEELSVMENIFKEEKLYYDFLR